MQKKFFIIAKNEKIWKVPSSGTVLIRAGIIYCAVLGSTWQCCALKQRQPALVACLLHPLHTQIDYKQSTNLILPPTY